MRPLAPGVARRGACLALCALFALAACAPAEPELSSFAASEAHGFRLQVASGTFSDGSGVPGLALLATLRNAAGQGPSAPWSVRVEGAAGLIAGDVVYEAAPGGPDAPASFGAWWWPTAQPVASEPYEVTLFQADGTSITARVVVPMAEELPVPQVGVSAGALGLTWASVPGAQAYECAVMAEGFLQLRSLDASPECDVEALPAGVYSASVRALSASFPALAAQRVARPAMPPAFHVSERRLAFTKDESRITATLQVAGGALHDGRSQPSLAFWLRLARPDGTPLDGTWEVAVSGPGIPSDAPLLRTWTGKTSDALFWDYQTPAGPGRYRLVARSGGAVLSAAFTVGDVAARLAPPREVQVTAPAGGGTRVSWAPVAGARAYHVSVWDVETRAPAATRAVASSVVDFAPGTFQSGRRYDVYVAAADVPLSPGEAPTRVSLSEDTFFPTRFTAP